ncbi:MAG: alpha/beta hydrolase family protein [Actinomycetota bacterium]
MEPPGRPIVRPAVLGLAVLALVAGAAPAAAAPGAAPTRLVCRDRVDEARDLFVRVDGELTHGLYSVPQGRPRGLVVFAHGYGHTPYSWAHHMREASRHGLIGVAMDYRGLHIFPDSNDDGLPESRGWPAIAGAEDSIAAARLFDRRCRVPMVTILGVSMGGNVSGLAVAMAGEEGITRRDGSPLWDYWVDVEGAVNLTEIYLAARLGSAANETAANARLDIEEETGCPIEACPGEFVRRTVPARMDHVRAAGLQGAVIIHGVDDGLVFYDHGRQMASLLALSGIPTDMVTVGLKDEDSERETTLTGHAAGNVDPAYRSPLAGHASEKSTTHIVMETALQRLWELVDGLEPGPYRECTANGMVPVRVACAP